MDSDREEKKNIVEFSGSGVTVKEARKAPFSGEQREIPIEDLDWDSFPDGGITMDIEEVDPVFDEEGDQLEGLRFIISGLTHHAQNREIEYGHSRNFWENVEQETGIRRTEEGMVALNGDMSAKKNLIEFIEYLRDNGHLSEDDLPIKSGWKWYLINDEPKHQNGDNMYQEEKIAEGVWVETKYSRDDIKNHISTLAGKYGEDS